MPELKKKAKGLPVPSARARNKGVTRPDIPVYINVNCKGFYFYFARAETYETK